MPIYSEPYIEYTYLRFDHGFILACQCMFCACGYACLCLPTIHNEHKTIIDRTVRFAFGKCTLFTFNQIRQANVHAHSIDIILN